MRSHQVIRFWFQLALLAVLACAPAESLAQFPRGRPGYEGDPFKTDAATEHKQAFGAIAKSARELAKKRGKNNPDLARLLGEILKDATFLQRQVNQWVIRARGSYPNLALELDPYFQDIQRISRKLAEAKKMNDAELLELARSVSKDLSAKAGNCRLSADGLGKQITVTAHTIQGTNEIRGFEVYFAPMALLGDKGEHDRFPDLSSPTTRKNFPPGYYAIWVKRNNATNAHTAQTIGGDGQPRFKFEIPVPEDFPAPR